jgi:hypothetical protein
LRIKKCWAPLAGWASETLNLMTGSEAEETAMRVFEAGSLKVLFRQT